MGIKSKQKTYRNLIKTYKDLLTIHFLFNNLEPSYQKILKKILNENVIALVINEEPNIKYIFNYGKWGDYFQYQKSNGKLTFMKLSDIAFYLDQINKTYQDYFRKNKYLLN